MADQRGPLDGIRVLELGQYIAAPAAAQILADQGATVVKVEPLGGEVSRRLPGYGQAIFSAYNRGKRMVELDLKTEHGQQTARGFAAEADVVLSNMRPGVVEQLGLGADDLREDNPGLVTVQFSGFGETPELRRRPGLDIAAQAESGLMSVTGEENGEPQRVGFPVVDVTASLVIAQAVTSALLGRARSGAGADIRISLWDVAVWMQATNWMEYALTGTEPARKGNGHPAAAPAAELIEVKDGHIVLSAYTPEHWRRLCAEIGRPDLLDAPEFAEPQQRLANRDRLKEVLAQSLSDTTRAELVDRLARAGIVAGSVSSYSEARDDQLAHGRGVFLPSADDSVPWLIGPAAQWAGVQPVAEAPAASGAHNTAIGDPWA